MSKKNDMIAIPIWRYEYLCDQKTRLDIIRAFWRADKNHYISPDVLNILLDIDPDEYEDEEGGA